MSNERNKNGIIVGLLVIIIVILSALVILFATGTISFKKANDTKEESNNVVDKEIDSALLNNLYDILGINWEDSPVEGVEKYNKGDCLNYYLSNDNYKEKPNDYGSNAQRIFALYASHIGASTGYSRISSSLCTDECQRQLFCADCNSVLKTKADQAIKLYGLEDYKLAELTGFDTDYVYISGGTQYIGICHYSVTHDLKSKYIDTDIIEIIDKQVVTDYEPSEDEKINSTKNQNVTYTFKKDESGNYYLSNVDVQE